MLAFLPVFTLVITFLVTTLLLVHLSQGTVSSLAIKITSYSALSNKCQAQVLIPSRRKSVFAKYTNA